jgi:glutamine synthetase
MGEAERLKRGVDVLPGSLLEAIQFTEGSELVKNCLGDHVFNSFIENKKLEWGEYRSHVTDYEINRYLPVL